MLYHNSLSEPKLNVEQLIAIQNFKQHLPNRLDVKMVVNNILQNNNKTYCHNIPSYRLTSKSQLCVVKICRHCAMSSMPVKSYNKNINVTIYHLRYISSIGPIGHISLHI